MVLIGHGRRIWRDRKIKLGIGSGTKNGRGIGYVDGRGAYEGVLVIVMGIGMGELGKSELG